MVENLGRSDALGYSLGFVRKPRALEGLKRIGFHYLHNY